MRIMYVCVCVCAAGKGRDVRSYYEIMQAKQLCFTIKYEIILIKMIHCGLFDQYAVSYMPMITYLLLLR